MQKGQAVLEFLFLILIIIVYITATIVPLTKDAGAAVTDTEIISRANNETQKITNTINEVARMSNGARQNITVFVPDKTVITCNDTNFSFDVNLSLKPFPAQCSSSGICTKFFQTAQNTPISCALKQIIGPSKKQILIERVDNNVVFTLGS
jgi:hypothetical protein